MSREMQTSTLPPRVGATIKLTIPAAARYTRIARLAAGGIATDLGFDTEQLDDFKIALDELIMGVLGAQLVDPKETAPLDLEFQVDYATQSVHVTGTQERDSTMSTSIDSAGLPLLSEQILRALVADYTFTNTADRSTFSFDMKASVDE